MNLIVQQQNVVALKDTSVQLAQSNQLLAQ